MTRIGRSCGNYAATGVKGRSLSGRRLSAEIRVSKVGDFIAGG